MTTLRKIFNVPTKEQKAQLEKEKALIMERCSRLASSEYSEQKRNKEAHDGQCPKCRAKIDDIVDKIRQVHGKGDVSGSFSLGFGSVGGSMEIDTHEVNHCNKCGNEWKKYKIKYIGDTSIVRVALNYLGDIFEDHEKEVKYSWKIEAIKVFEDCSAEAILELRKENSGNLYMSTDDYVVLRNLRIYFKSIYDKPESTKQLKKFE